MNERSGIFLINAFFKAHILQMSAIHEENIHSPGMGRKQGQSPPPTKSTQLHRSPPHPRPCLVGELCLLHGNPAKLRQAQHEQLNVLHANPPTLHNVHRLQQLAKPADSCHGRTSQLLAPLQPHLHQIFRSVLISSLHQRPPA